MCLKYKYPVSIKLIAMKLTVEALFNSWLASRPARGLRQRDGRLAETSAQLYRDMWSVFAKHLAKSANPTSTQGQDALSRLQGLTVAELEAFLRSTTPESGEPNDFWSQRYAWRMLHLIDRVLTFHNRQSKSSEISVAQTLLKSPPYCYANASSLDTPPELLSDGEVEQLVSFLQAQHSFATDSSNNLPHKTEWKRARDIAAVGLMLGAGLAPSDLQALLLVGIATTDGPIVGQPWRLTVSADGLSPQHQTPIAPWAGQLLARWLDVRRQRNIPGGLVFPSTLKGTALSRMSCHRCVVQLLSDAGISGGVPFRLRNTFAVRQLSLGHSEETVGRWLGLVESKAMRRYVALASPAGTVD